MAGYSATPLVKKLGLKPPLTVWVVDKPADYEAWLGGVPDGVRLTSRPPRTVDGAHVFVTERARLEARLRFLREQLAQDGFVWVSWPKKSAKVPTDISEDVIRELALPMGFVDVKVCAVSEVWSGLKLVIRKSERR